MKKGFTLIEILAVVTLMGLIFILVIPKIANSLRNKKSDIDSTTTNLVLSAAKLYVQENSAKFKKINGNISCVPINTLVKNGYLDSKIKDVTNDIDITNTKSVKITYDAKFNYELVNKKECSGVKNVLFVDNNGNKFKRTEYIEGKGAQYINTGIYPKSTTKVKFEFLLTNTSSFCRNGWGSSGGAESYLWGSDSVHFQSSVSNDWNSVDSNISLDMKKHIFELESGSQKLDGIEYGTSTIGNTAEQGQTMYLFASHVEWSNQPDYWCSERIYSAKIYEGDVLVRDYIPAIDYNEIRCLFDNVERKCYYNQGDDIFYDNLNNDEIYYDSNKNKYKRKLYIESDGSQYINTGIYPKSTTKVKFEFSLTNTSSNCHNGWGSGGGAESYLWGNNSEYFQSSVASNWNSVNSNISLDMKKHIFELESGSQKLDGIEYGTSTIGNTAEQGQTMYLFASHVEWSNQPDYWCSERIYSAKIYDGDTLVRDYIPVINSSNRPCLFDKVGKTCYYNQGPRELLYG